MEKIEIDTLTMSPDVMIGDTGEALIHQHGGIVTKLKYSEVTEMSTDVFIAKELPKKEQDAAYVLRDLNNKNLFIIHKDAVLKYKVEDIADIPLPLLTRELVRSNKISLIQSFTYPLVAYISNSTETQITMFINTHKRRYKTALQSRDQAEFEGDIFMPPLWYKATLNKAGSVINNSLAVVLEQELDPLDTKLYAWPLGNVHTGGDICMGTAHIDAPGGQIVSEAQSTAMAFHMLMESIWNLDLLRDNISEVHSIYNSLPKLNQYECKMKGKSSTYALKILRILSEPTGYLRLPLKLLRTSTANFLDRETY